MNFQKFMDYEKFLRDGSWKSLGKLPTLSVEQIEQTISSDENKLIFKIIYGHQTVQDITVKQLLHLKDFKSAAGEDFLMLMGYFGHINNFDDLLSLGCDSSGNTSKKRSNPLLYACMGGHINMYQYLMKRIGFMRYDRYNANALLYASYGGKVEMFKYLADDMAFYINHTDIHRLNALLYASLGGNIEMFQYLVSIGFDPHYVDKYGRNALLLACQGGHIEMFNYLVSIGFDINFYDHQGSNALINAAIGGSIELIKKLVTIGFDINYRNKKGQNALSFVLTDHKVLIVKYLVRSGCLPNSFEEESAAYKKIKSQLITSRKNLTIFYCLCRFAMILTTHRYWSPNGKGYNRVHDDFETIAKTFTYG